MRHRGPDTACPWCGTRLDTHSNVTGTAAPEAGDISVTDCCVNIVEHGKEGSLDRVETSRAEEMLRTTPQLREAVVLADIFRRARMQ